MARKIRWFAVAGVAALLGLVTAVALVVRAGTRVPDDVQPIEWHVQPCAHCQMLVGEPSHAAQLITQAGEVLAFDDPGCALHYLAERKPVVHRLWFHAAREPRWLAADAVAFLTGGTTPMASGLLAVDRGTPSSLELAAATARLRAATAVVPTHPVEQNR